MLKTEASVFELIIFGAALSAMGLGLLLPAMLAS